MAEYAFPNHEVLFHLFLLQLVFLLENYDGGSGKYNLLMEELLPDLLAGGHRILIFSQFTSMLELIAEGLKKQNMTYYRLDGATKVSERKRQVEEFF